MALPTDSTGPRTASPRWWIPPSGLTYVLQLSPLRWWISHWEPDLRRTRRCGGELCALCQAGSPAVVRFVLLIEPEDSEPRLFELPRKLRSVAEELDASPAGGAGSVLAVHRESNDAKSAISVGFVSVQPVVPREILPLVATLGLPPILLADAPRAPLPASLEPAPFTRT